MSRDPQLWIRGILEACHRIQVYVAGLDQETFEADTKTFDAVPRNLAVIGQPSRRCPTGSGSNIPTSRGARFPDSATS